MIIVSFHASESAKRVPQVFKGRQERRMREEEKFSLTGKREKLTFCFLHDYTAQGFSSLLFTADCRFRFPSTRFVQFFISQMVCMWNEFCVERTTNNLPRWLHKNFPNKLRRFSCTGENALELPHRKFVNSRKLSGKKIYATMKLCKWQNPLFVSQNAVDLCAFV